MDVAESKAMIQPAGRLSAWVTRACWIVLLCFSLSTFITFFSRYFWLADLLANLRVQLVMVGLLVLLLGLLVRHWCLAMFCCVLLTLHLVWFDNAFPSERNHGKVRHVITMTSINVLSGNKKHDEVLVDVSEADPDVIAVLELTPALDQKLRRGLPRYSHVIARPSRRGNFGIGVYSKYPLEDPAIFESVEAIESVAATVVVDHLDRSQEKIRVFATHPLPPMNASLFEKRNRQLEDVANRIHHFRQLNSAIPVVLLGDLNLTPWSPLFLELQSKSGLVRGISNFTVEPTWYRFPIFPFGLVIDHGLIEPTLTCTDFRIGESMGSDHRSITLRLAASD